MLVVRKTAPRAKFAASQRGLMQPDRPAMPQPQVIDRGALSSGRVAMAEDGSEGWHDVVPDEKGDFLPVDFVPRAR
eukprot:10820744-Lingulodinium_polyedra.AAC.1